MHNYMLMETFLSPLSTLLSPLFLLFTFQRGTPRPYMLMENYILPSPIGEGLGVRPEPFSPFHLFTFLSMP